MKQEPENIHLLNITFLVSTKRVRITSYRFDESILIPYTYKYTSILDEALEYLKEHGATPIIFGEAKKGYIIGIKEFKPLKEIKKGISKKLLTSI